MKRYAGAVVVMSALFVGFYSQQSQSQDATEKETAVDEEQKDFEGLIDRFSYAYGADLAEKLKAEDIDLNVELMAEAMRDVFEGSEKRMSEDEVVATIGIFREVHQKQQEEKWAAQGEINKKESEKFLAENAKKEGIVVTDSGLQYKVINEGSGGYKPKDDDIVTVHFRGMHIDGTEFDSTYKRDEPFVGKVKRLIPGWAEALRMMTEGAKWEVYIPSEIAYGEEGSHPFIGPHAALIFEVELLEIEKAK